MREDLVEGHILAIDLSEPMDRIVDKDEDLEYLDDYRLMNPYILQIAREKIKRGGEIVLQEFEDGFDCTILGEECGKVEIGKEPKGFLIMDAIDGSTNAVRGVPFFCCSLAYATENKLSSVSAGIVQDLSNGDAYWAASGKGAFLNGTPMHVYSGEP